MAGRKKNSSQSGGKVDPNAWMVTFGDLIMLLLTFFVLLLSMKTMDGSAVKDLFNRFASTFGPMEYSGKGIGESVIEGMYYYRKSEMISSADALEKALDLLEGIDRVPPKEEEVKKLRDIIEITEDKRGVVITLEFDHLFDSGKAEIRHDSLAVLDAVGKLLRYAANDILIMGHTDNVPVRGGEFESNWEISFYRALSVFFYFADNLGFNPGKIAPGGYGEFMPRYPNDSEENRTKNRRVEFVLRKPR